VGCSNHIAFADGAAKLGRHKEEVLELETKKSNY
jgi:hypothetical protein